MAKAKRYIPDGLSTVTASVVVEGAAKAIDWYRKVFGATERGQRHLGPDGKVMHAELQLGSSVIFINDAMGGAPGVVRDGRSLGGSPVSLSLYVEDCDTVFNKATENGSKVMMPLGDQFWGDRWAASPTRSASTGAWPPTRRTSPRRRWRSGARNSSSRWRRNTGSSRGLYSVRPRGEGARRPGNRPYEWPSEAPRMTRTLTARVATISFGVELAFACALPVAYLHLFDIDDPGDRALVIGLIAGVYLVRTSALTAYLAWLLRPIERWMRSPPPADAGLTRRAARAAYDTPLVFAIVWATTWLLYYLPVTALLRTRSRSASRSPDAPSPPPSSSASPASARRCRSRIRCSPGRWARSQGGSPWRCESMASRFPDAASRCASGWWSSPFR